MHHIQVVRNGFPDAKFFGNTFVALNLVKEIENSELVAKIKEGFSQQDQHDWQNAALENLGMNVSYCQYLDQSSSTNKLIEIVKDGLRTNRQVVVNYHFPETDMQERLLSMLPKIFGKNVKQYMHLHCSADFFFKNAKTKDERKKNLIELQEKGLISKYIAVSYEVRISFEEYLPAESMEVVRNGVSEDIYTFRPERDRDAFKNQFDVEGKFIIGYSGRLDAIKGYHDIIAILKWFDQKPEFDVGFLIASPGGTMMNFFNADLKRCAPRLLSENRIGTVLDVAKLTGGKKGLNDLAYSYFDKFGEELILPRCQTYQGITSVPLQAMVDVYIQPSESEGLPLSVIEAVFTGTPAVAYRVGGIQEIISDTNGKLIDHHKKMRVRVNNFCEAILYEIEQNYQMDGLKDTAQYREETRTRLLPEFGAKAMAERTLAVYNKK